MYYTAWRIAMLETKHVDGSTCSANFPSGTLVHVHWLPHIPQKWTGESDPYFRCSQCLFLHDSQELICFWSLSISSDNTTKPSLRFYDLFSVLNLVCTVLYHYHLLLLSFYSQDQDWPWLCRSRTGIPLWFTEKFNGSQSGQNWNPTKTDIET